MLAHCNFLELRELIRGAIQQDSAVPLTIVELKPKLSDLYAAVGKHGTAQAVEVLGLETLEHLDRFWIATNQVREEFRKHLPFPVIIWVNDQSLTSLIRRAPDFHNWAAPPIVFTWPPEVLIDRLESDTQSIS